MATTNGVNGAVNGDHMPALSSSAEEFLSHNYDYVIVGGGTAGLVIAARLTENPDVTVGVLEAGKNKLDDMFIDTPALFLQIFNNPDYDWQFMTEPQVQCLQDIFWVSADLAQKHNHNKIHHIPRGKALGGSSAINYVSSTKSSIRVWQRSYTNFYVDDVYVIWGASGLSLLISIHF